MTMLSGQEKALVGAFSVIVKTSCGTDGALHSTSYRGVGGQGRGVLGLLAGITDSACPAATPPNLKESGGHDDGGELMAMAWGE